MRLKVLALVSGLALALAAPAWAGSVTFNFSANGNGDLLSNNVTFTVGSSTMEAFSFACTPCTAGLSAAQINTGGDEAADGPHLFFKTGGGDETGLGLVGTTNNEVGANNAIGFDTTFAPPFSELSILGSLQAGENFNVFGCVSGSCTSLGHGTGNAMNTASFNVPNASDFEFVYVTTNGSGNLLLDSVTVSSVPEPASLALFGTALLLLAGFGLRRYRRAMGKMSA